VENLPEIGVFFDHDVSPAAGRAKERWGMVREAVNEFAFAVVWGASGGVERGRSARIGWRSR